MNYDLNSLPDLSAALHNLPHDQKWNVLRPVLEPLYRTETIPEIAEIINLKYSFSASNGHYRYRFKGWGSKKNVPREVKDQILDHAESRALLGKRTAASFGGIPVDVKKLKRHVTNSVRGKHTDLSCPVGSTTRPANIMRSLLPFGDRLFVVWSMPLGAIKPGLLKRQSALQPDDSTISPPGDILVNTPSPAFLPDNNAASPNNAPSPFSTIVATRLKSRRTRMFLRGQFEDMVTNMSNDEMRTISTWLYQFWFHSFKSAQSWGRDSQPWTAERLEFGTYGTLPVAFPIKVSTATLGMLQNSSESPVEELNTPQPTQLCRWSIHVIDIDNDVVTAEVYSRNDLSDVYSVIDHSDVYLEAEQLESLSLDQILRNSFATNEFSSIPSAHLPFDTQQIAKIYKASENMLLEESLAFAIFSRNIELIDHTWLKVRQAKLDIINIYPFHLATTYLDGGNYCCTILARMAYYSMETLNAEERELMSRNSHGHTVLDNLMLTILRSHSNASISVADRTLKRNGNYAGYEVDICGRWDADSPCFRALISSGMTTIPFAWKHKFCHTSIQAICHSIRTIHWAGLSTAPSGLFRRLCKHCGKRLELQPLHCLIMVGFELANHCCQDEDLFGIVACFLCLVVNGENPLSRSEISVESLSRGDYESEVCTHGSILPSELVNALDALIDREWSESLRLGWKFLAKVCQLTKHGRQAAHNTEILTDGDSIHMGIRRDFGASCGFSCEHLMECHETAIAHLWAAVQTELLNYRRLNEGEGWVPNQFDMKAILASLLAGKQPSCDYIDGQMMKDYCLHGNFGGGLPLRAETSTYYFSNMDCWERTSFLFQ